MPAKILIFTIAAITLVSQIVFAQREYANINLSRIQREINMMETILGEMTSGKIGTRQLFRSSRVRGVYIPEVGLIFRMSGSPFSFQYIIDAREGDKSEAYVVSPGGKVRSANADAYRALRDSTVVEFLEYYADASGQLRDTEQIIIVYEPEPITAVVSLQGQTISTSSSAYGYTISAKKADIARLRARQLSSTEFRKNIARTDLEQNGRHNNQLHRFANVCQSMLNETENAGYRIYGEVSNLFLDDFGAIFMFDAVQARNDPFNIVARIREEIKRKEIAFQKMQEMAEKRQGEREINEMLASLRIESDSVRYVQSKQAYNRLEQRVTDLLLDYGRTLRFLDSEQKLTIAIKIRDNTSYVPERVVFQVKKADLDAYDANKMTRRAMAKRISIKRYGQ